MQKTTLRKLGAALLSSAVALSGIVASAPAQAAPRVKPLVLRIAWVAAMFRALTNLPTLA